MDKINIKPACVFSPQPMYIIGTKNEDGTPNFCLITWIGFSFDKDPHIMMTIGGTKLTKSNILREGTFSANLVTDDTVWLADYFGTNKGELGSKDQMDYHYKWGEAVNVPIIEECHWVYECKVKNCFELEGSHLFLGDIKNIQIDKEYENMNLAEIDLQKIKPSIYAPGHYFSIGERLGNIKEWERHV